MSNGVVEHEIASPSEAAAMAGALRVPRAAHDSVIDERRGERADRRGVAGDGEAAVLLLRVPVEPAFRAGRPVSGAPGEGDSVLEDVGAELFGE